MENKMRTFSWGVRLCVFLIPLFANTAFVVAQQVATNSLYDLSLEELMDIEVYSAAKKGKSVNETASAVYVISEEDIRRSGAVSLPEVLRLAPGLQVTRVNANTWSVAARGFSGVFANKLLVMIDGRTVYRPVFSGTFWDQHLIPLTDVKQIEVIRGPGATVWGANAVNGVINIIRKTPTEEAGTTVTFGTGSIDESNVTVVDSRLLNETWSLKLYGNEQRISSFERNGVLANDGLTYLSSGFRSDGQVSDNDSLTFQGDLYRLSSNDHEIISSQRPPFNLAVSDDIEDWGGNVMTIWRSQQSDNSTTTLQSYYDRFERNAVPAKVIVNTVDLDFQHNFAFTNELATTYGIGWRLLDDQTEAGESVSFEPANRTLSLFSSFAQAEIALCDSVELTVGSKFERNDYTGFELQPNLKAIFQITNDSSVWASIARAVRTPARTDNDLHVNLFTNQTPDGNPNIVELSGNRRFESENLLAFETGVRKIFSDWISLDLAAFLNNYEDLSGIEQTEASSIRNDLGYSLYETPTTFFNSFHGNSYGAESSVSVQLLETWKLVGSYSWIKLDLAANAGHLPIFPTTGLSETAENIFNLRSLFNLSDSVDFDTFVYYVDCPIGNDVPSFVRTDFRVGWNATPSVSLSLALQNAFDSSHREASDPFVSGLSSDVPRSIFGFVRVNL